MCKNLLLKILAFVTIMVVSWDEVDSLAQCVTPRSNELKFLLMSRRNQTGHWTAQVRLDHDRTEEHPVKLDMKHITSSCEDSETISILVTITVPPEMPVFGYELFPGLGYYKMHTKPLIWTEAKTACAKEGAHLTIINSEAESSILKTIFNRHQKIEGALENNYAFIGMHDLYNEGHFETIFGDPLNTTGFMKWTSGEPNNSPFGTDKEQDCGGVSRTGNLHDLPCNSKYAFFCESEDQTYA